MHVAVNILLPLLQAPNMDHFVYPAESMKKKSTGRLIMKKSTEQLMLVKHHPFTLSAKMTGSAT